MKKQAHKFSKPKREPNNPISPHPAHPAYIEPPERPHGSLTLELETILPGSREDIQSAGKLVFHALGDTGGIHGTDTQERIAAAMQTQLESAPEADRPRFLYHLGDVVYFNGEPEGYQTQFYEPYQNLDYPIFAVPGNHDHGGDPKLWNKDGRNDGTEHPLQGFMDNFCAPKAGHLFKHRTTMTQPHCYWSLITPLIEIIGLDSNVDGLLDAPGTDIQSKWLRERLSQKPDSIVALHHPPYSLDSNHGGYPSITEELNDAFKAILPYMVLSGHVHNYQRFALAAGPQYIVAGAGGYANGPRSMHRISKDYEGTQTSVEGLTLESHNQEAPGFLRIELTPETIVSEYYIVPFAPDEPAAQLFDRVEIKR